MKDDKGENKSEARNPKLETNPNVSRVSRALFLFIEKLSVFVRVAKLVRRLFISLFQLCQ
jgi:hypothetical protein